MVDRAFRMFNYSFSQYYDFLVRYIIKVVPVYIMNCRWASGCTVPLFLTLRTTWRWVAGFMHQPFDPQGKRPCYPLNERLSGPQSQGAWLVKKNSCPSEMQMSAHEFIVSVHILIASLIVEIVLFVSTLQNFFLTNSHNKTMIFFLWRC